MFIMKQPADTKKTPPKTTVAVPAQNAETTKRSQNWIYGGLVLLLVIGVAIVYYLRRQQTPLTNQATVPAIGSVATTETTGSTVSNTTKTSSLLPPNKAGTTYSSNKLGVAFYLADTVENTPGEQVAIKTKEVGNKTYVYVVSDITKPEDGQSIEMFTKDPQDTLAQAITKKFLSGISPTDCFVRPGTVSAKAASQLERATIGYPIPEGADPFESGQKCPANYKESNGSAYFLYDQNFSDRFYYLSIGQYGIPAHNGSTDSSGWQETIVVGPIN